MEAAKTQTTTPFNFDDSEVSKWELPEGAIARLGRGSVRDMEFSPDGQYFVVGSTMGLWIYQYPAFSPIALWETDRGYIDKVTFSPDGQWIAAYTYLQALRVWDIQNKSCIAEMEFRENRIVEDFPNLFFLKMENVSLHIRSITRFTLGARAPARK